MKGDILIDDGAVDLLVNDFEKQENVTKNCVVQTTLSSITYGGDDVGNTWKFTVSLGGQYNKVPQYGADTTLNQNGVYNPGQLVMTKYAKNDQTLDLDVHINAIEDDLSDDFGETSKRIEFTCNDSSYTFSIMTVVKEDVNITNEAKINFLFDVTTRFF